MATGKQTLTLTFVLVQHHHLMKFASDEAIQWAIEHPGQAATLIARRIDEYYTSTKNGLRDAEFPIIWKTLRLGTNLKTADGFRMAFKKAGAKIGDWGNDILGKPAFKTANEETEVDLVVVTVGELGFKRGAARRDIIAKALELGLRSVPLRWARSCVCSMQISPRASGSSSAWSRSPLWAPVSACSVLRTTARVCG
ncbi:MAG: hypothetical protein JWN50_58 [Parcubacteria group bacterium]|nr:hypothetical protein [Parcubacteria group bacterium]